MKTVSPGTTIFWGILISLGISCLFMLATYSMDVNWLKYILCFGLPFAFFISGFTTIAATQEGLLTIFGERQRTSISEGVCWLPPFMDVLIYNCKEQTYNIDETEILSANRISIKLKLSFNWKIVDVYQYSNLDGNVIVKGLSELVLNELRNECTNLNDTDLINSNKTFVDGIIESCNRTSENKWGIYITEIFVSAIKPSTKNMQNYYESSSKIKEIAEDSATLARILGISPKEALDKYARERMKVKSIENIYSLPEISQITSLIEKLIKK